jgi:DNA-directed RNA polymerase specialized sigma24 family protein
VTQCIVDNEEEPMREGNASDLAARSAHDREPANDAQAEVEGEPATVAEQTAQLGATIWRVMRAMGVDAEAVHEACHVSLRRARDLESGGCTTAEAADADTSLGVAFDSVISPQLRAAFHAASDQWRGRSATVTASSRSGVRSHDEMLVLELLGSLDEGKRACVVLADIEGLSTPEIAALTGAQLDTVYEELRRARRALARALCRQEGGRLTADPEAQVRGVLQQARAHFTPDAAELSKLLAAVTSGADHARTGEAAGMPQRLVER